MTEIRGWIILAMTLAALAVPMIRAIERNSAAIENLNETMKVSREAQVREFDEVKGELAQVRGELADLKSSASSTRASMADLSRRLERLEDRQ